MPLSLVTQRFMCAFFVVTMICGVWQYAAVENALYFEDREGVVSEEICEYAVTQRTDQRRSLAIRMQAVWKRFFPCFPSCLASFSTGLSSGKSIFAACKMIFFLTYTTFTGCFHSHSLLRPRALKPPDRARLKEGLSCPRHVWRGNGTRPREWGSSPQPFQRASRRGPDSP